MGIVGLEEKENIELQEFCRLLVASAGLHPNDKRFNSASNNNDLDDEEDRLVCVTSGVSFLGLAVVNRLLLRGYSVRIIVDHPEDVEKLREMRTSTNNSNMSAVMAKLSDVESLSRAFDGCRGVFHTSAFADPAGLSGYTKSMAEIEVRTSQNVMEACAMAPSVRKCVLTSSLLACVWRDNTQSDHSPVINHHCWSNESICTDKKLWYALGKLKAEKAAWRIAEEKGIKLATICPGLITGPEFSTRNPTPTIAYLKGAQEMYQTGVLATVDMMRLADAHVSVFEAMKTTAFGRYICFDQVIEAEHEAGKLAEEISLCKNKIIGNGDIDTNPRYQLSNRKLRDLLSRTLRFCYSQSQEYSN